MTNSTYNAFADFIGSDSYQQHMATTLPSAPIGVSPPPADDVAEDAKKSLGESWGLTPEQVGDIDLYAATKHALMMALPEARGVWMTMLPPEDAYHAVAMARHLAVLFESQLKQQSDADAAEMAIYAAFYMLIYYNWDGTDGDES